MALIASTRQSPTVQSTARPELRLALLCSAKATGTIIVHGLDLAIALKDAPITLISGFQSPLEKEVLKFLLKGSVRLVVCPARSAVGMRIPTAWKKPMAEDRLTVRSFIDEQAAKSPRSLAKPKTRPRRPTTDLAEQRNRFVAVNSDAVLILHASPGGKLERLAKALFADGKVVWTLDDPANEGLVAQGAEAVSPDRIAGKLKSLQRERR